MPRRIDTQAVIYAIRLDEQGSDPAQPAAGYRIIYAKDDGIYEEDDAGVVTGPFGAGGGDVLTQIDNGRLTLTTATPVTTADVTGATTLYFTPYKGNQIALYDGVSAWELLSFTEKSLSLVGYTASKPYDIWAYNNSGTVALESTVWTDTTTRATALTTQDGVYVKTGATTRRYLGTIYINSSGGQTDDSVTKRFVWNYYNRVPRPLYIADSTSHNYTTAGVWRSWNNDANIRVQLVIGLVDSSVWLIVQANAETSNVAVGYDVTNASINSSIEAYTGDSVTSKRSVCTYHFTGLGYHFYQIIEEGISGNTNNSCALNIIHNG